MNHELIARRHRRRVERRVQLGAAISTGALSVDDVHNPVAVCRAARALGVPWGNLTRAIREAWAAYLPGRVTARDDRGRAVRFAPFEGVAR